MEPCWIGPLDQLLPLPILYWSVAVQFSVLAQRSALWTSAVQCTVPSGLQEMVTLLMFRWHVVQPPGVGVMVAVLVLVTVGVLVKVLVGAWVLVLVGVFVTVLVNVPVKVCVG